MGLSKKRKWTCGHGQQYGDGGGLEVEEGTREINGNGKTQLI